MRSAAAPSGQRDPTWSEASPMACLGSFTGSAVLLHLSFVLQLELTFLASTRIPSFSLTFVASILITFVASIRTFAFFFLGAVRVGGTPAYRAFLSDCAYPCKRQQQPSHPLLPWPMAHP